VDKPDLLTLLKRKHFKPAVPADRQIASQLRDLIQRRKIAPHTRLPSIRKLADLWETNFSTVHDALKSLVTEGLIVLSPAKGSFVAPPRRALRRICIYQHQMPETIVASQPFYPSLNLTLYRLLSKRGVTIVPYLDHRPYAKLHSMPPDLRKMSMDGEIDAVIATEIYPHHARWLLKLEVPAASLMLAQVERRISVDVADLANVVIKLALEHNRKNIGFIRKPLLGQKDKEDALGLALKQAALQYGISVILQEYDEEWALIPWEQTSARLCEEFLRAPVVPDMLFIYPDSFVGGVALTLVKHRIRVPEDILVVSHRNAEIKIYMPFPMIWLTVKVEDFALGLIEQIDRQIMGEPLRPVTIDVHFETTSPPPEA
jgi:DNA-binding transcriptional regulator YhcF (GntR family)